jgi:MYXO-CTERM domain-containing protein
MRVVSGLWIGWISVFAACGCSSQPKGDELATQSPALDLLSAKVSEPFETDAPVPALGRLGHDAGVAFDGVNYAAVFEDQTRVHAVRVAPAGRVLDLDWLDFELEVDGALQLYPSLAFGGGKYLATWSESNGSEWLRIRGQLFSPDGTLDGEPFTISSGDGIYSSVTFDGTDFVVAYQTLGSTVGVSFCRVSTAGARIDGSEHAIAGTGAASGPAIAHAGTLGLVVWHETGGTPRIRATRIAADGQALDTTPISVATGSMDLAEVAVAGASGKFLVAYRDDTQIRARLIDATSAGTQLTLSPAESEAGLPAVAASDDGFVVAWADSRDERSIRGVRVSNTGQVLDAEDKLLATGKPRNVTSIEQPSLTAGGDQLLLGFIGDGVEGSLFSSELTVQNGDFPISAVPNAQGAHQVGWNGQSYVITWVDERNGRDTEDMDGRAARFGADGARLDPDGLVLAEPGTFSLTQAGGAGGEWLAIWHSITEHKAFVRSVNGGTLGAVHELTAKQISTAPAVAFDGSGYLSVYAEFVDGDVSDSYSVFGRPIAADGTPGAEFPIETGLAQPPGLTVFGHGDGYVLASSLDRVTLRTLTATGTVGEPISLQEGDAFVSAASNGEELLIASIDQGTARVSARFFADGALRGDSIPLADTSSGSLPAVAWDGEDFAVVWDEAETRVAKGRSITPAGTVSTARTLVDAECYGPWLASNGAGQLLLSCVRYDENYVRRIDSYFLGGESTPKVPPSGGGGRAGTGGSPSSGGGAGGEPVVTAGTGGRSQPSASGGTSDAGQPGAEDAGEGGLEPGTGGSGGAGGRGSTSGSGGKAGSGGVRAIGGTAGGPAPNDDADNDSGDDGGCSVGSHRPDSSSAWLSVFVLLALGVRRRRS